jgi:hypothetical protein
LAKKTNPQRTGRARTHLCFPLDHLVDSPVAAQVLEVEQLHVLHEIHGCLPTHELPGFRLHPLLFELLLVSLHLRSGAVLHRLEVSQQPLLRHALVLAAVVVLAGLPLVTPRASLTVVRVSLQRLPHAQPPLEQQLEVLLPQHAQILGRSGTPQFLSCSVARTDVLRRGRAQ